MTVPNRDQILGVRITNEFIERFDLLCDRLGYKRSEVVRFCLNRFLMENIASEDTLHRTKSELF